jgi:Tfp pilus assembly protein PilF
MASKRPVVLLGILLVLVLAYVSMPTWERYIDVYHAGLPPNQPVPPLPGQNSVSGLEVHQDERGRWIGSVDYFYTGEPRQAFVRLELTHDAGVPIPKPGPPWVITGDMIRLIRGRHHVSQELPRPLLSEAVASTGVVAKLLEPRAAANLPAGKEVVLASQYLEKPITWPDAETWVIEERVLNNSSDAVLSYVVSQIDAGEMKTSRRILERLLTKDPKSDAAYLELARIAMKTNWGPDGLHQAEVLISSALQINPENPNSHILLGYVYAHQGRYQDAEALFVKASKGNPRNLWLWANWGELLAMQNKMKPAIQTYRRAIEQSPTGDTYDRARLDAYEKLLVLVGQYKSLDEMEALYKQRADEYHSNGCYEVAYARFMLQQRGNASRAREMAEDAVQKKCTTDDARQIIGMAQYVEWANASPSDKSDLLNRARIYLPASPSLLYRLASSDRTYDAVKKLIAAGEPIDQVDNNKFNALAYAVANRDYDTARRLLRLRARPEMEVGPAGIPLALIPVMNNDLRGIGLMRQFGVDYTKIKYQGMTAFDHAKQVGDRKLLEALAPKGTAL